MPRPGRPTTERAKNFKGTLRQLIRTMSHYKLPLTAAMLFAILSTIFNIAGPKVLAKATTALATGWIARLRGTGSIDFVYIGRILLFLLGMYLLSSAFSFIQGWLMTGVTQKICYRMRKEIAAKIAVVPMSYFNGHSIMTLTVSNHFIVLSRRKKECLVRNFLLQHRCNLTNLDIVKIFRIIESFLSIDDITRISCRHL